MQLSTTNQTWLTNVSLHDNEASIYICRPIISLADWLSTDPPRMRWAGQSVRGWRVSLQGLNLCKPGPSLTHLISNYMTKELILASQSGNSQRFTGSPSVGDRLPSEPEFTWLCVSVCRASSAGHECSYSTFVGQTDKMIGAYTVMWLLAIVGETCRRSFMYQTQYCQARNNNVIKIINYQVSKWLSNV